MQNRTRKPWFLANLAGWLLMLSSACGQQATATPNPTTVAVHAATLIASLPTAESLTPRPKTTVEPTGTAVLPTSTPAAVSTATPAVVVAVATSAPANLDYTVQAGDTLLSIAMNNHVSMAAIMLLNDMADTQVVKLGQLLHIPTVKTWPNENVFWFVYIVRPGEALSTIATHFSVKVDDLVQVNQLSDASAISVGQKLVIPVAALTPNVPTSPEPTTPPAKTDTQPAQAVVQATDAPAQVVDTPAPAKASDAPAAAAKALAQVQVQAVAPAEPAGADAMRAQLLALYNEARAAYGRTALAGSVILQAAAQGHAEDCAQRGYGSHSGSDGSTSSQRIARAG
ncbi:MAG TPA: LysM peptidoglycan-binding domain-containing protein, partial [Anaerolineae bacterium]